MSELEKDIENKVCKWAAGRGFICLKIKFVETGWPDRLFISPEGHTIFIEFKRRGHVPTPLQMYRITELQKRGIPASWHDTYVGAVTTLKAALESAPVSGTSDKAATVSSIGGPVPGPGTREDLNGTSDVQDPEAEGVRQEDVDSGSTPPGPEGMA
jgi:hypothetical protein